jgi:hypothetical protein
VFNFQTESLTRVNIVPTLDFFRPFEFSVEEGERQRER